MTEEQERLRALSPTVPRVELEMAEQARDAYLAYAAYLVRLRSLDMRDAWDTPPAEAVDAVKRIAFSDGKSGYFAEQPRAYEKLVECREHIRKWNEKMKALTTRSPGTGGRG